MQVSANQHADADGPEEKDGRHLHLKPHADGQHDERDERIELALSQVRQQHHHTEADEEEQEDQQTGQHAVTGEAVYAGIAQYTAACEEGGVEDEDESDEREQEQAEERRGFALVHQHQVARCYQGDPGHERCVLHRVPRPETTKAERFIGPGPTHEDAGAQDHDAEEGPRQRRRDPSEFVLAPQACDAIGEGNQGGGETQE